MNELVKDNSFGAKDILLVIDEENIRFQDKVIKRAEISEIKYWISSIIFYKFSIGNKYYVGVKSAEEQIDFVFKSYFGIADNYFSFLTDNIIEAIWEPAIQQIWNRNIDLLFEGNEIRFGACQLSKEGIVINKDQLLNKKSILINWEDLQYLKKYDRLELNSTKDAGVWKNIYYKDCWNMDILMSIIHWIKEENGLAELRKSEI